MASANLTASIALVVVRSRGGDTYWAANCCVANGADTWTASELLCIELILVYCTWGPCRDVMHPFPDPDKKTFANEICVFGLSFSTHTNTVRTAAGRFIVNDTAERSTWLCLVEDRWCASSRSLFVRRPASRPESRPVHVRIDSLLSYDDSVLFTSLW